MNTIKWFAAVLIGAGAGAGITASAAPGDLVYAWGPETVTITAPQAAALADEFIALGAWSGARADMTGCTVGRANGGFEAYCSGLKSAAPGNLPVTPTGVRVVGVVE